MACWVAGSANTKAVYPSSASKTNTRSAAINPHLLDCRRALVEPLQVAMDNGARCALIPAENKRSFLEVNTDVIDKIDPIFYNDVKTATFKGLELNG